MTANQYPTDEQLLRLLAAIDSHQDRPAPRGWRITAGILGLVALLVVFATSTPISAAIPLSLAALLLLLYATPVSDDPHPEPATPARLDQP